MSFNFIKFASDHNIPLITDGHKHCRPGWIQLGTDCLFCNGNPGYHLGYNLQFDYFNCWRCGNHWNVEVISKLLSCSPRQAIKTIQNYKGRPVLKGRKNKKEKAKKIEWPPDCNELSSKHKKYLESRNFLSESLIKLWNIKGTGKLGSYKHRIIAPIYFEGQMVSYQGRDITNKQTPKYKACASDKEIRAHKHCLYGFDLVPDKSVIVCEGIFDVWRFGPGAVATFGIDYVSAQFNLLRMFNEVFICFDANEIQAMKQAEKLGNSLSVLGVETEIVDLEGGDPAELTQDEANAIKMELLGSKV